MPIYEYRALNPLKSCSKCRNGFEIIQGMAEESLVRCPECDQAVRKLISKCYAAVYEQSQEGIRIKKEIRDYEKTKHWSHAAELADKFAHESKDPKMKERALDNYKKAGYSSTVLDRHNPGKDE